MTSRSCSVTIRSVSAAVLLCLSCFSSQQDSVERRQTKIERDGSFGDDGAEDPLAVEVDSGAEGGDDVSQTAGHEPPPRPCPPGQMQFEDRCQPKERVDQIVEERETKAILHVHKATEPGEKIDATRELIEQQVTQMEKAEDDLDEIIQQLERRNIEADLRDKVAGVDGKIEKGPL